MDATDLYREDSALIQNLKKMYGVESMDSTQLNALIKGVQTNANPGLRKKQTLSDLGSKLLAKIKPIT